MVQGVDQSLPSEEREEVRQSDEDDTQAIEAGDEPIHFVLYRVVCVLFQHDSESRDREYRRAYQHHESSDEVYRTALGRYVAP